MLEIVSFTLGPAQTNAYLVADPETKEAAVIDPAWDGDLILARRKNPAGGSPISGIHTPISITSAAREPLQMH